MLQQVQPVLFGRAHRVVAQVERFEAAAERDHVVQALDLVARDLERGQRPQVGERRDAFQLVERQVELFQLGQLGPRSSVAFVDALEAVVAQQQHAQLVEVRQLVGHALQAAPEQVQVLDVAHVTS